MKIKNDRKMEQKCNWLHNYKKAEVESAVEQAFFNHFFGSVVSVVTATTTETIVIWENKKEKQQMKSKGLPRH